ncbi:hypothetical protein FCM35_KLT03872 [Carex littledalei]|uniref:Uncharacterized protein n=1 Tax=Carex littledalei TaxID=544730 RepID=A0A833R6Q6_9POAL|nr:hypothetical protein FCM35_KLT03872 [Carex littledalei]
MSGVARKFGGGKSAVGTPSLGWSSVVVVVSLLAGASIVHNIYKPDLTLPPVESVDKDSGTKQDTEKPSGIETKTQPPNFGISYSLELRWLQIQVRDYF